MIAVDSKAAGDYFFDWEGGNTVLGITATWNSDSALLSYEDSAGRFLTVAGYSSDTLGLSPRLLPSGRYKLHVGTAVVAATLTFDRIPA